MEEQGFTIDRLQTGLAREGLVDYGATPHLERDTSTRCKKSQIKARTRGDRSTPKTLRVSIISPLAKNGVPHSLPNQSSRPLS